MTHRLTLAGAVLVGAVFLTSCTPQAATFTMEAPTPGTAQIWEIEAEIIRVIDGDTIAVVPIPGTLDPNNDAGDEHRVRILGIDTPEMNYRSDAAPECGAQEATDHLEEILTEGQAVTLKWDAYADRTDRYGRSLTYVYTDDSPAGDVGGTQIAGGYATPYVPQGEPKPEMMGLYEADYATAIENQAGPLVACGDHERNN